MKKLISFLTLLLSTAGVASSESSDNILQHELLFNGSNQVLPLSPGNQTTLGFNDVTFINLGAGYNYTVVPDFLQTGIASSLVYTKSGGTSGTIFSFLVGATVNLPFSDDGGLEDALFLSLFIGLVDTSSTDFAWRVDFGKRFEIFKHVVWRPSAGVFKISGSSALFVLNLMSLSIAF